MELYVVKADSTIDSYRIVSDNAVKESFEQNSQPLINRYIELVKNEIDVNPCTGESKKKTMVDIYVRDDRVDVMGWGWFNTFRPNSRTIDEIIEILMRIYRGDGFKIIADVVTRGPLPSQETDFAHNMVRESIEFINYIPEIHPDTRQIRDFSKLMMYKYDDRVEIHSWNSVNVTKPEANQTVSEISIECIEALIDDGYSILSRNSTIKFPSTNMDAQQWQDDLSLSESVETDSDMEI